LAKRLPVPNACRDLACLVAEFHAHCHRAFKLRPATILKVLNRTDAFRRPDRFEKFLLACTADARGRTGFEESAYPQANYFRGAFDKARNVEIDDITGGDLQGSEIGKEINQRRENALQQYKDDQLPPK
jgi:tRNA nucleotidyltransferase (CCA-adding enzyme)